MTEWLSRRKMLLAMSAIEEGHEGDRGKGAMLTGWANLLREVRAEIEALAAFVEREKKRLKELMQCERKGEGTQENPSTPAT